jgi:hypothetical protein
VPEQDLVGNHWCFRDRSGDASDSDDVSNADHASHADNSSNADGSSISDDEDRDKATGNGKRHRGPAEHIASLVPTLLVVCKQINNEAGDLLYSHRFHFENPLALHSFIVDVGPRVAALLKHVDMLSWSDGIRHKSYNHTCFTALMSATNLVSFNAHGYLRCRNTPRNMAIQVYRDAFPWLETVGRKKGKADAAVDIFKLGCINHYSSSELQQDYKLELRKLLNAREDRARS